MNIKLIYQDKTYQFDISKDVTVKYIEYLSSQIFRIAQHEIELVYNNEIINKNDKNSLLIDSINNNEKNITIIVEVNKNINDNNNINNDNQSQSTFDSNNINFYKIEMEDIYKGNQKIKKEKQFNYLKSKFCNLDTIIIKEKNFGKKFGIIFEKIFSLYENALIQFKNSILKAEKCFSFFFDYSLYNKIKKIFINNLTADKLSSEEILNLNIKIENINENIKYIQTQKNFYVNVLNIFKKKINTINKVNNFFNIAVLQFNYVEFMKNLDNAFKILMNDNNNNNKEDFNKTLNINNEISSKIRSRNIMNNNYLFGLNSLTLNKTISNNRNSMNFSNFKTFNNEINNNNENNNKLMLTLNSKRSIKLKKIVKPENENLNSDNKNNTNETDNNNNNENVFEKRKMKKKKTGKILNIEKISDTSLRKSNKGNERTSNNSIKFKIKKKMNEFGEIKIPKLNLYDISKEDKNSNITEKKEEKKEPQIKNNTERKKSLNSIKIGEVLKKNKNLKEVIINENNNDEILLKDKNEDNNDEKNDEEQKEENNNNENNNENENDEKEKEENLENENKEQIINTDIKLEENEKTTDVKRKKKRVINKYDFII